MPTFHFTLRGRCRKKLCVLSAFCLNGQVSLGKISGLLMANTEITPLSPICSSALLSS